MQNRDLMTHLEMTTQYLRGTGIEIGAHQHPIEGIHPIYVDKYKAFREIPDAIPPHYFGTACKLPFYDNALDYIATSHVLEHLPNPALALREWHRVLRPGGLIYMVVPDKHRTFDHTRAVTPCSHLISDFEKNTEASDPTHINELVDDTDWTLWKPDIRPEDVHAEKQLMKKKLHQQSNTGRELNIHFHTFEPASVVEFVHWLICRFYKALFH